MSEKLTIAQALRKIKRLKGQIAESEQRAKVGVSYESDKVPAFRYQDTVDNMFLLQDEVVALESRVAVANATHTVVVGESAAPFPLATVIRTLQEIKGRIAFLKGLHLRTETVKDRTQEWDDAEMKHIMRVTETTYVSDLSEQARDTQIKKLQDRFEKLNNAVEDANHTVEV